MSEYKGFFGSLFDLSFTEFVTTRIIKFLFVLVVVLSAIAALGMLIYPGILYGSNVYRGGIVVLFILLSPVVFFLCVIVSRVWLELMIVIFRIAENTGRLVEQGGHGETVAVAQLDQGALKKKREDMRSEYDAHVLSVLRTPAEYSPETLRAAEDEADRRGLVLDE